MIEKEREKRPICDTSGKRSDICEVEGDVRVQANSTIFFLRSATAPGGGAAAVWLIRPYVRKGSLTQSDVKQWTIRQLAAGDPAAPACTTTHAAPAVVFSAAGFTGNIFYDLTDVLIPLFITSYHFHSEVHLLVSDNKPWWVARYLPLLSRLSRYEVIDAGDSIGADEVRCFPKVILGPVFRRELRVDASLTRSGYSMADFRELLVESFGLRRRAAEGRRCRQPRLLIISRKKAREFHNERGMAEMARSLGFEVVTGDLDGRSELDLFARLVNTADVMIAAGEAELANMVFLPPAAVVVQVAAPPGGVDWPARSSFREPAEGMGLRYLEYRVKEDESSLAESYPVLKDPIKSLYIDNRSLRPHLSRLRLTLLEALQLLPQPDSQPPP
ncbi:unnamed protein product [Spirodela intermedia]|uniref:Glycosyltransferase 61 catalytic domain-containing protein n=1 Tax=Spirodela intermedia TaxID=51605 RepID=A0A7I8KWI9_SPIIN|nr:unnamed protein product [Spirodela intermedia]